MIEPIVLMPDELVALTGCKRAHDQLEELRRQGFWRARRSITGRVIVERAHYEAVCRGESPSAPGPKLRPA